MKKIITLCTMLFSFHLLAASPGEMVQAKLNAIQSMQANFTQTVKAGQRNVSTSSGTMALLRPGRFRWATKEPMAQIIVADNQKLWIYDVELKQVTVKKQDKGIGGTPALFLSGNSDTVARDFSVTVQDTGKTQIFDLHALSAKENYQRVKLSFEAETLKRIEFYDQLGQYTDVNLTNIKTNPKLNAKLFIFSPPKGVDIVTQ